ncbi:MAG TPA: hypothetical protein VF342_15615 [Alphaproteobacteria bacterium]
MRVKRWRFATLMLSALTTAMGFCHLMELPARMSWDQSLWVSSTVIGGLYRMFGTLGAVIVVANIIAAIVLAVLVRRRGPEVFWLTAVGAALFVLALASWWIFVFPVNLELATWLSGDVPADWAAWRAQWEYAHAINAVLQIVGLAALVLSVLAETPADRVPRAEPQAATRDEPSLSRSPR